MWYRRSPFMYPIENRWMQKEISPTAASIAAPSGSYRIPATMLWDESAYCAPLRSHWKAKPSLTDSWRN